MKKISSSQYAQVLFELTKDKEQSEIDEIVARFIATVRKNDHWKQKNEIIRRFKDVYNEENNIVVVDVISARKLLDSQISDIERYMQKKYDVKHVNISQKVEDGLIGGLVMRVKGEVIDASISNKIAQMKKYLIR